MGFVIINSSGKRIKKDGKLTPYFDYAEQAKKYIDKKLGGSPYLRYIDTDKISKNMLGKQTSGSKFERVSDQGFGKIKQNLRSKRLI